jgi:hypothetical protein
MKVAEGRRSGRWRPMELAFGALKDGMSCRSLIGRVGIRDDVDKAGDRFWYTEIRVYGRYLV